MNILHKIKEAFNPEKDDGKKRPIPGRVASSDVNDKFSNYPSNGLTPQRLARLLKEADEGIVRSQMELFEEMEEKDTHLFSQLQTRKLAVTGLDFEVQAFSKSEIDMEIAAFVEEQIKGIKNLSDIFTDMLDAIGKGISISEIMWGVSLKGQNIIEDIKWIHPKKLVWDSQTDEMLICTKEFPAGISLPLNKFVVHKYKAKSGHESRAGLLRIVSWMYLFKNYDVKDWVSFCELFGMPLRLGTYSPNASEEDKEALMEAIVSLGTDAAGMVAESTKIEFIESQKTSSVEIYEKFARYADEQMSKAILGQTLTSDSGGGSYAQGKVHNDVRHDLTIADAKSLAATFQNSVIRPLVEYNFGSGQNIPLFQFDCQDNDDPNVLIGIYKTLTCDMGLEIPKSHIRKKFAIPEPKDNEEVITPTAFLKTPSAVETEVELKSLKESKSAPLQEQIDQIANLAVNQSNQLFTAMFAPILKVIDKADSLESLQMALSDKESIKALYEDMNEIELEELIRQGIYISNLLGRAVT